MPSELERNTPRGHIDLSKVIGEEDAAVQSWAIRKFVQENNIIYFELLIQPKSDGLQPKSDFLTTIPPQ